MICILWCRQLQRFPPDLLHLLISFLYLLSHFISIPSLVTILFKKGCRKRQDLDPHLDRALPPLGDTNAQKASTIRRSLKSF
ncbi:uncharacterized protein BDR25DRAFT_82273 [Lindgomyces ingoldianus]|uniref:Uncharacterized protein n=1 Tax=Lindgomyces ingoldianus TaxID=673940 RepID=A0ACB6QGP6_9PLEO|nr:uncharacterized protein BDR25DRAFT_82273 [Lindgomyces ingoldianus]KAF2465685.1 hypothetical protein BDR25DRAFT_82273 [Lindgomyces ingoldianus]